MSLSMHLLPWGAVIGASLAAAIVDIRTSRIPNWLTLPLAGFGLIWACTAAEPGTVGEAVAAWGALALPYIVLFLLAGGGAGDAKMMGAIGTWLGLRQGLIALACVALTGGILALARMIAHRERRSLLSDAVALLYVHMIAVGSGSRGWQLLRTNISEGKETDAGLRHVTIPYGMAIFLGVCVAAVVVQVWND